MENEKLDLQVGDRITYKSFGETKIALITDDVDIENIQENIRNNDIEIIKIERPHYEVIEEKKELLTEEEKEFLKLYMKLIGFEKDIEYVKKESDRFLHLFLSDDSNFEIELSVGENFKNLKNNREYTLKELGLEES